ncbi:MAG TPA: hypothetical protein DCE39_16040, partial [Planctomycetaceae bacterium]|nr:hypothetical protein [Planctomycetaceae bacterium]
MRSCPIGFLRSPDYIHRHLWGQRDSGILTNSSTFFLQNAILTMSDATVVAAPVLESFSQKLLIAAGATDREAEVVADHLVESSLLGHDSHGILRLPEYLGFVAEGSITAGAEITVDQRSPSSAVVDCGLGFGPVGAVRAIETAIS